VSLAQPLGEVLKESTRHSLPAAFQFFHEIRGRKNKIEGIYDASGIWRTGQHNVVEVFCSYFASLFAKTGGQEIPL
jgi:hypothetical protein